MSAAASTVEPLWLRAARALHARVVPMPPADFWKQLDALGWGRTTQDPAALAAVLQQALAPDAIMAMRLRFEQLDHALARAVEFWELQREEKVPLTPGLQRSLREHIIALGEEPYLAALQGPWRVKHRAEHDDYLEGFGACFDGALQRYPDEVLQAIVGS